MPNNLKKYIPQSIKRPLIQLQYVPEKLMYKTYYSCANGKIPCPDKLFQKWDYKIHSGKKLSFKNPQTYNEKLQWLKYYYRNPEYTPLVDKYEVRKFVEEKIGNEILVPCYGVFDKWEDIDFDSLPDKFVVKCTHDSGSISICKGKDSWNKSEAEKIIKKGLNRNQFYLSREWPYKNVKPRIIVEKYLENIDGSSLIDYKFFCFDGNPVMVDVLTGKNREENIYENFYNEKWELLPLSQGHTNMKSSLHKPDDFNKMIEYAKSLSQGMPHVRVDFLKENDKLYFTELTFFNCGGRKAFHPDEYDKWLGDFLKLPEKMR